MDRVAQIQNRFAKAVMSYDDNAVAQKQICEQLFAMIEAQHPHGRLLEVGCGSGNLSLMLSTLGFDKLTFNDLCSENYTLLHDKILNETFDFFSGDAVQLVEKFRSQGSLFECVVSASAVQWFDDPIGFINSCADIMESGSLLAISSFAPNNLHEVCSITGRGLKYASLDHIREGVESRFEIIELYEDEIVLNFNSPLEILHHLKDSGVTATSEQRWSRGEFKRFQSEYNRSFRQADGACPLTYRPIYLICRRL